MTTFTQKDTPIRFPYSNVDWYADLSDGSPTETGFTLETDDEFVYEETGVKYKFDGTNSPGYWTGPIVPSK